MRVLIVKTLLIAICLLISLAFIQGVHAQELNFGVAEDESDKQDNTQKAEQFYKECIENPIFNFSEESDSAFCACSASSMYSWLEKPIEDDSSKEFFEAKEERVADKATLISEIYGPCLHIAVFDQTYEECFYDRRQMYFYADNTVRGNLCLCYAQIDSDYFEKYAKDYLIMEVAKGKDINDPIEAVKSDTNYYDYGYIPKTDCLEFTRP